MLCMIEQPHAELCVMNWLLKISDYRTTAYLNVAMATFQKQLLL